MTVRERDFGAKRLGDLLRKLSGPAAPWAAVGIQGTDASAMRGDGINGAGLAAVHEFGARLPNGTIIPARSFLRATLDEHAGEIESFKRQTAAAMMAGTITPDRALDLVGMYVVGLVQQRIAAGIEPALADSTIERKGSSVPLIETGVLRASITNAVRRGEPAGAVA